jgi:hypothetical protein
VLALATDVERAKARLAKASGTRPVAKKTVAKKKAKTAAPAKKLATSKSSKGKERKERNERKTVKTAARPVSGARRVRAAS